MKLRNSGALLASTYVFNITAVAAPWPQIPPPCQTDGANLQFPEPAPTGNKFFRLRKP